MIDFVAGLLWRSTSRNFIEADGFVVVIADQYEVSMNAIGRDVLLQQRGGELNSLACMSAGHDRLGAAAVISEKFLGRDMQAKSVSVHGTGCWHPQGRLASGKPEDCPLTRCPNELRSNHEEKSTEIAGLAAIDRRRSGFDNHRVQIS